MRPVDVSYAQKQGELFRDDLFTHLNSAHPLLVLAKKIQWRRFDEKLGELYSQTRRRPGIPTRIMVGLHYLKHAYNLSDDEVLSRFQENPYYQVFCGAQFFDHNAPCDSTAMVKWRQRVGEEGLELLLQETCAVAVDMKLLKPKDLQAVTVDTTVQEKNIRHPTDAKLLDRARERLVKEAVKNGITLRQTYTRNGKHSLIAYQRYCHAKQFKRAKKPLRKLRTYLGRVIRDIQRKHPDASEKFQTLLALAIRIYEQKKDSKDKVYSVHEPLTECISKGKSHKRFEFGCKASLVVTNRSNWIIGARAHHGRPYDGHTLEEVLELFN